MKLLLTTNGRLYKTPEGKYYTPIVYGYSFFQRYLNVFDDIRLVAHVENADLNTVMGMMRVDGPHLEVFEVPFPHGKIGYLKKYTKIKKTLKTCHIGCNVALLRIPDQLAFQVFNSIKKKIPCGIEVTSNSWEFYAPNATSGFFRPFLRVLWDYQQKKICREADTSSYVTAHSIQKRYPPAEGTYTTHYSNADPSIYSDCESRDYGYTPLKQFSLIHVSGSISGKAKGHHEIVGAITLLKQRGYDVTCTLVGSGNLDEELIAKIRENRLKIKFAGRLNAQEIKERFLLSNIFVFPSYREGLPRVVVEAMASGIMCIASDIAGNRELLDHDVLVPTKNENALANKIEYYITHPELMTIQSKRNINESKKYSASELSKLRCEYYDHLKKLAIR